MKLQPIVGLIARQIQVIRGNPVRLAPSVTWVCLDLLLFGFLTRYLNSLDSGLSGVTTSLLYCVLLWDFSTRVMQDITAAFLEDMWSRNLLNLFAAPVSIAEYLISLICTGIAIGAISLSLMIIIAVTVFDVKLSVLGYRMVPLVGILMLFGVSLGILSSATILRFGQASEWMIWSLPELMSPFAAVLFPLTVLPHWMQSFGSLLPPSYVFDEVRAVLSGTQKPAYTLIIAAALVVAELALCHAIYRRVHARTLRSGMVVRFTAETTN